MPNTTKGTIPDYVREAYLTQKRRREFPKDYFLLVTPDGERKFPVKNPKTGKYDEALVLAAIRRAAQYGYPEVEKKARAIYEMEFATKKDFPIDVISKDEVKGEEVLGIVLVPDEPDGEGDIFTKDAVKNACYQFNRDFMNQTYRHQHFLTKEQVEVVESYIAPVEMRMGDKVIKEGTWLMRSIIHDPEIQKDVREGRLKGFSVGGYGER